MGGVSSDSAIFSSFMLVFFISFEHLEGNETPISIKKVD
jgi:hypothetical protein